MVGNKHVTCRICLRYKYRDCTYSTNRPYNLGRHEKAMHKQSELKEIKYHSTVDVVALMNKIVRSANEYRRKLELGREIKQIVQKVNAPKACLDKENMEALELFENYGQVSQCKPWSVDEKRKRKKEYMKVYMKKDGVKQRMKESKKRYREKKKIMKRVWEANEYQRKLELGKQIREIVLKNNIPTESLDNEQMYSHQSMKRTHMFT